MESFPRSNNPVRDTPGHDAVRYEERDVRFGPLILSMCGLLVLLLVVAWAIGGLFAWWAAGTPRRASPSGVVQPTASARELQDLRIREAELLNSYGWVSREDGIVRIPLERAIELALEREMDDASN